MAGAERFCSRWTLAEYAPAAAVRQMEKDYLILKCASDSRPSGEWNDDDYDLLADGVVVGRTFKATGLALLMVWLTQQIYL
jgi:hypothetical protein